MTNINIEISGDLHKKIKLNAVLNDKTIKDFIIDSLKKEFLKKSKLKK